MRESASWPNGSSKVHLPLSGSLDSSSLKPSSLERSRTMRASIKLLLTSSATTSRSVTMPLHRQSLSLLMMAASSMACSWRVPVGMTQLTALTNPTLSSSTLSSHLSGSCLRTRERSQLLAFITALSTRFSLVLVPYPRQAIPQTSASLLSFHAGKKRRSGSELA